MTADYPGGGAVAPLPPPDSRTSDVLPSVEYSHVPPRRRSPLEQWLSDYNPFYLLSACCMLLGCFVLNDSLDWSPLPQPNLLVLIATLNVYEFALIGLGLFLIRRGLLRDGLFLLLLESFFVADAGFLYMEAFAADVVVGLVTNVVLLGLAAVKLAIVFNVIGLPVRGGLFAFALVQLGLLLGIPGVFADVSMRDNGNLPAAVVTAAWWAFGFVPVLYVMLVRLDAWSGTPLKVAKMFLVLPFVSIVAHLCLANWVYNLTFQPANLSPLLLGLTAVAGRYDRHVSTLATRMRTQLVLPALAVALAALDFSFAKGPPPDPGTWSPLRLALLGATLAYLDGWWLHRHAYFLACATAAFAMAGLGASVRQMVDNVHSVFDFVDDSGQKATEVGKKVVPSTPQQWGVTSVAAAFVLLAVGAAISLRKRPVEERSA